MTLSCRFHPFPEHGTQTMPHTYASGGYVLPEDLEQFIKDFEADHPGRLAHTMSGQGLVPPVNDLGGVEVAIKALDLSVRDLVDYCGDRALVARGTKASIDRAARNIETLWRWVGAGVVWGIALTAGAAIAWSLS